APGPGEARPAGRGGDALLLLPHRRVGVGARRGGVLRQRPGDQENLIEQLKNGVRALRAPVNTLEANGAYLVIGALAWSLKAWLALVQPRRSDARQLLTMKFRKFLDEVMLLPCQIVRSGHCLI